MRHMYLLSLVLLLALTENILMQTTCGPGYGINRKRKCVDDDECESDPSICGKNARCFNTVGSYYCQCHEGFTTNSAYNFTRADGIECEDINECVVGSVDCGPNTKCVNSEGGYNCTCEAGYISSNGKQIFNSGQGVQCNELKCDRFLSERDASQTPPELTKLVSLMTNSCLVLSQSESVKNNTQVDGEKLLKAFLSDLDDLHLGSFSGDNDKISALFRIVVNLLKRIGHLLSASRTRKISAKADVELLVKRGNSPPEGDFMMNISGAQLTSHWDTATGNTHHGFMTAALLSYKGLDESLSCCFDHLETQQKQTFKINSKVVTATFSNYETTNLKKPIKLTFSHLEKKNEKHMCVFWDPELDGGAWSTRGCTTVRSSADQTVCSCSHLSSFAVLMALYDIGDVYELRVVTLVGLSLSLICFFICIVTFYFVRSIQSTRNTIHLHLCISLFIAYFVFLVGITRTENKVGCAVVAGILHYFFLSSFCWMCLEGVQLFRMVVLVFNTTLRPIYMFAAGYGVPAVIVAISATANASGYGTDKHCWLSIQDGFIWSFYGPVCIIIIANVFFFLITIWKLAEKFSSLNPDLDSLHKIKAFTVTAIAQLCILGIMWVFGCFQFNENTLAMSYIFTILSSLQGVLMFIMHCWLSKQVRDEYAKFLSCICTPQKRKYSEFTSNQTSKQQASRSDTHTGESHI